MATGLENARGLYLHAIGDGDYGEIDRYAGDRYVQHSHPVPDGKEGFKQFFAAFVEREPDRRMEIVRSFQDRQYVFLHVVQVLRGAPTWVTMDIFDTDADGRLIEHWDVISAWEDRPSGPSMVDGPTAPGDEHRTEENKNLVRRFLDDVLVGGRHDLLPTYVAVDDHVEHGTSGTDGLADLLGARGGPGGGTGTVYRSVRLVLGDGDLVATLSHAGATGEGSAVIDLFRVADGRVVEHWDSVEEIVPRGEWLNSGKF